MVKVFLVPNFHYDTIYQETYESYLEKSFRIIKKVLEILRKYPDYKYLIEQTVLLEEFWKRNPQYREDIEKYIREKRIECAPGFFVMPDMNLISGESLIRQIVRGKNFLRKFNVQPKVAWISDCWGHHRQLPQILKKAGYEGYVFSRGMPKVSPSLQFLWKGIDGTEIPTYWMATGYFGIFIWDRKRDMKSYIKDIKNHLRILKKFKKFNYVLLPNGGDFVMPDEMIIEIINKWNKKRKDKIYFSTPSEYFENLKIIKKPVLSCDFNPMFNGTYTSRIEIKQKNRLCENRLYLLQLLQVFYELELEKENKIIDGKIDEFEYYLLFNQFHDIICGSILDKGYLKVMEYYEIADRIFADVFQLLIDELSISKKNIISVLNQCSFTIDDICFLEMEIPENKEIKIYDGNKEIKTQIFDLEENKSIVCFKFSGSPFERKNLRFKFTGKRKKFFESCPFTFENKYFKARVSEKGLITNLILDNLELVNQEKPFFGEIVFQRDMGDFWVYYQSPVPGESRFSYILDDPYPENVPKFKEAIFQHDVIPESVIIEKGNVGIIIKIQFKINYWKTIWQIIQLIMLYYELPFIDYRTIFFANGKNYRIRVAFPTNIKNGKIRREIPFGVEYQKEGEYPTQNFIEYYDDEKGICLINKGLPGNSVQNNIILLSLFRSVDMGPNKAISETGFSVGKKFNFEYRILPFKTNNPNFKSYLYGISFNKPFLVIPGVKWKNKDILLRIKPQEIPLTCLQKLSRGQYLLRIYEPEGKKQKVEIETKERFEFFEISIDGQDKKEKIGTGRKITLHLNPYEIKTILLCLIK